MVKSKYGDSFVIADIPGIIEGASKGEGLGIKFLRHIERTRLLLHFIDVSGSEGRDPVDDYNKINNELKEYSKKLANRTQIIIASKADLLTDNNENYKRLEEVAKKNKQKIFKISSSTGEGIDELMKYISSTLKILPKESLIDEDNSEKEKLYTLDNSKNEFKVEKQGKVFVVTGEAVDRIIRRVNITDYESLYYLHKKLDEIGLNKELKKAGVKDGDTVKIGNYEMEWED